MCARAYLFVGALVNAAAVGRAVSSILARTEAAVTVVACGERWPAPTDDGELRVAIEDYLGAGAILWRLSFVGRGPLHAHGRIACVAVP